MLRSNDCIAHAVKFVLVSVVSLRLFRPVYYWLFYFTGFTHHCENDGTLHGLEDEETGSIFAPATKCCTNGEGSYFAPKITKGDLICLAAIVLNESGMNRWCW